VSVHLVADAEVDCRTVLCLPLSDNWTVLVENIDDVYVFDFHA